MLILFFWVEKMMRFHIIFQEKDIHT